MLKIICSKSRRCHRDVLMGINMEDREEDDHWGDVKNEAEELGLDMFLVHTIEDMSR